MHPFARTLGVSACISLLAAACGAPTDSWTEGVASPAVDSEPAPSDSGMDTVTPTLEDDSAPPIDAPIETGDGCELPPRDCVGTSTYCAALVPFEPVLGPGYDNYAINGETASNQYRSYARRDLMMLVKYASAFVACKAKGWTPGNGAAIGLGDMSEKSGAIPGTSIGSPGHPAGSHTNGYDMDLGYYQTTGTNNYLRAVCPHTSGGYDAYHCTGAPTILDVRRTALFLGAFVTSDRTRIIGVDGKIGPLVVPAMQKLCDEGTLPRLSCDRKSMIAYEVTDTGRGWYKFHHHHFHVSLKKVSADWSDGSESFAPSNTSLAWELEHLDVAQVLGHAHVE